MPLSTASLSVGGPNAGKKVLARCFRSTSEDARVSIDVGLAVACEQGGARSSPLASRTRSLAQATRKSRPWRRDSRRIAEQQPISPKSTALRHAEWTRSSVISWATPDCCLRRAIQKPDGLQRSSDLLSGSEPPLPEAEHEGRPRHNSAGAHESNHQRCERRTAAPAQNQPLGSRRSRGCSRREAAARFARTAGAKAAAIGQMRSPAGRRRLRMRAVANADVPVSSMKVRRKPPRA